MNGPQGLVDTFFRVQVIIKHKLGNKVITLVTSLDALIIAFAKAVELHSRSEYITYRSLGAYTRGSTQFSTRTTNDYTPLVTYYLARYTD